jgi:signal peptidase II
LTDLLRGRRPLLIALFAGILIADRITKILAERSLSMGGPVEVIPGFFQLTLVHNTGMAFGLLGSAAIPGKAWLLTAVSAGLLVAIVWFAWRAGPLTTMTTLGIVAMLAGAIGNILDRILYGYVVDFVDLYVGTAHWPAFNVADAMICTGVGLLVVESVRDLRREAASTGQEDPSAS